MLKNYNSDRMAKKKDKKKKKKTEESKGKPVIGQLTLKEDINSILWQPIKTSILPIITELSLKFRCPKKKVQYPKRVRRPIN